MEKILTVSARDYCESQGKELSDYRMVGIHVQGSTLEDISRDFYQMSDKIEVIVNYQFSINNNSKFTAIVASGTALIPHKKDKFD